MIGVFDSGFGGLHVLKSVMTRLPHYGYIYLGDSKRAPYGSRSQSEVYTFTKQGVEFLFAEGASLVMLACNTASSEALRKIQMEYLANGSNKKVLGVLIPFAEVAALRTKTKRVGVLATEGTVRSGSFTREIQKLDPHIDVYEQACPLLVPLVEAGKEDSAQMAELLQEYLAPVLAHGIDTLVLGCTHYCILQEKIKTIVGTDVQVISELEVMPEGIVSYLARHPEIEKKIKKGESRFFTTGDVAKFETLGSRFFGGAVHAKQAVLGI